MSAQWKAAMPKQRAEDGMSDFVFAFRSSSGERVELSGKGATEEMFIALRKLQDAIRRIPATNGAADNGNGGEK